MSLTTRFSFHILAIATIFVFLNGKQTNINVLSPLFQVLPTTHAEEHAPSPVATKTSVINQKERAANDASMGDPSFSGTLEKVDLRDHPMTVMAVSNQGTPSEFVFGGDLTPGTNVLKNGKSVGVKSLKQGERVTLIYKKTEDSLLILRIRIH
ncbi:MAG: hypothetical protein ACYC9S_01605 [Leptospirales bacterium]